MASLEYLQEEMQRALEVMDDNTKPANIRHAARSRFWHCEKRVGTMLRGKGAAVKALAAQWGVNPAMTPHGYEEG